VLERNYAAAMDAWRSVLSTNPSPPHNHAEAQFERSVVLSKFSKEGRGSERYGSLDHALLLCIVGSAVDVRQQLQRLIDAGLGYFELRFICHSMASYLEMIQRVAEDVVPALRD